MNKEESYTEQVFEGKKRIIDSIKEIQEWQSKDENQDKDLEDNEDYRSPLAVDTQLIKKIVLSTGGPEDGFKLYFDEIGDVQGRKQYELSHGVYYRADWGEYKERQLEDDEAQLVYDFYLGGEIA